MLIITMFLIARGRISRSTWFSRLLLLALACAAMGTAVGTWLGDNSSALFSILFLYSAFVLSTQRLHDIGRSGWTLLWLVIPVLGPLWVLLQFLKVGAVGSNRYGTDPAVRAGYLTVDIER